MTIDTIKQLGAEFHRAADDLGDTLAQLDNARRERLTFLRRCSKDSTARLAALKEEIRTLPEQIAKWDAEAARLESMTAEDLLRQALEVAPKCDGDHKGPLCADKQCWLRCPDCGKGEHFPAACGVAQEKPEPYRAGLPPERLRKVWAEWESKGGTVYAFKGDRYQCDCWLDGAEVPIAQHAKDWPLHQFRPHGATWARVEAMADEAERARATPQPAGKRAVVMVGDLPYYADSVSFDSAGKLIKGEGVPFGLPPVPQKPADPPAPTLLDLTKLPPGTVCEATADIPIVDTPHVIKQGQAFRIITVLREGLLPVQAQIIGLGEWWLTECVPARVVKEGGEP